MPRDKNNPDQFIAGALPTITYKKKTYFVDGRLNQLRNTTNPHDVLDESRDEIWRKLSKDDKDIIRFEFYGTKTSTQTAL